MGDKELLNGRKNLIKNISAHLSLLEEDKKAVDLLLNEEDWLSKHYQVCGRFVNRAVKMGEDFACVMMIDSTLREIRIKKQEPSK